MIRLVLRLFGLARRGALLLVIVALLATNVLAFTSSAFVGLVGSAAGALGLQTVQAAQAARTRRVARSLAARTVTRARNVVRRLPAKTIPVVGGAATLSFAVLEVADACETLTLARDLDPEATGGAPADVSALCDLGAGDGAALLDLAALWSDDEGKPAE